jgi:hypothetical protein
MDEGLFRRHLTSLSKRESEKKRISDCVLNATGILLEDNEFSLSKKEVTLSLSSVKKSKLFQKGIVGILKEEGYTLA